jgi:hypothetical protein
MGQSQAACQDKGFCGCWAQEADNGEVAPPANPGKTFPTSVATNASSGFPSYAGASPAGSAQGSARSPMCVPEPAAYSAPAPAPAAYAAPAPPPVPTRPTTQVTFDFILSDLESAEQVAYGEAFTSCTGGGSTAQMDNVSLRSFILNNSIIAPDDLDPHLIQVADDSDAITVDGFLHVLRENAVSDTATIEQFLGMASNQETVAAEECRSGLLLFSQRTVGAQLSEEKWDRVFNTVMWDADVTVSLEKWIFYCKVVARIIRLSVYCRT